MPTSCCAAGASCRARGEPYRADIAFDVDVPDAARWGCPGAADAGASRIVEVGDARFLAAGRDVDAAGALIVPALTASVRGLAARRWLTARALDDMARLGVGALRWHVARRDVGRGAGRRRRALARPGRPTIEVVAIDRRAVAARRRARRRAVRVARAGRRPRRPRRLGAPKRRSSAAARPRIAGAGRAHPRRAGVVPRPAAGIRRSTPEALVLDAVYIDGRELPPPDVRARDEPGGTRSASSSSWPCTRPPGRSTPRSASCSTRASTSSASCPRRCAWWTSPRWRRRWPRGARPGVAAWLALALDSDGAGARIARRGCSSRSSCAPRSPLLALVVAGRRPRVPVRLHAAGRPVAGLGDRAGHRGRGGDLVAAMLPWRWRRARARARSRSAFLAFVAYALLSPPWAYRWEAHPGNEPKTLRMAVALGHWMSLDVEPVSAADGGRCPPTARSARVGRAARGVAVETGRMAARSRGGRRRRRDAIRATRVTRQTIRGKEGGVYHVLAPGPSVLLAPALRVDRWLNRRDGRSGRLAVTRAVVERAGRGAGGGAVPAAARRDRRGRGSRRSLAGAAALDAAVPLLLLPVLSRDAGRAGLRGRAARGCSSATWWRAPDAWALGALLATLPWLHQKFLPAWAVLAALGRAQAGRRARAAARRARRRSSRRRSSLFLFALYNFAITGSVRPDALFLAWGPGGVSGARVGQGLLGLAPRRALRHRALRAGPPARAAGGLLPEGPAARARCPAMAVYYLTVAAADNWSGAVCNLGRYFMPAAPFAVALVGVVLARAGARAGVRAVALTLAGWTAVIAWLLWHDPHAANDCAQLLARSAFADGNVYVPNLFLRAWADAAPGPLGAGAGVGRAGRAARVVERARGARAAAAASPLRAPGRRDGGAAGARLRRSSAGPRARRAPAFPDAVEVRPGVTAFLSRRRPRPRRARARAARRRVRVRRARATGRCGSPACRRSGRRRRRREIDVPLAPRRPSHRPPRRGGDGCTASGSPSKASVALERSLALAVSDPPVARVDERQQPVGDQAEGDDPEQPRAVLLRPAASAARRRGPAPRARSRQRGADQEPADDQEGHAAGGEAEAADAPRPAPRVRASSAARRRCSSNLAVQAL